jgi:hypothetical protein
MEIEVRCCAPMERSVRLLIEPWAEEFQIEAGEFVRLTAGDVLPDGLEFVWDAGPTVCSQPVRPSLFGPRAVSRLAAAT